MDETSENMNLSARLKQLRMQTGLSQKDFAAKVKLAYAQYNRYERGDNIPNAETLGRLADALDVSVDYLIEGNEKDAAIANFADKGLLKLFQDLETLDKDDKEYIQKVLTDLVKIKKFKQLAS